MGLQGSSKILAYFARASCFKLNNLSVYIPNQIQVNYNVLENSESKALKVDMRVMLSNLLCHRSSIIFSQTQGEHCGHLYLLNLIIVMCLSSQLDFKVLVNGEFIHSTNQYYYRHYQYYNCIIFFIIIIIQYLLNARHYSWDLDYSREPDKQDSYPVGAYIIV